VFSARLEELLWQPQWAWEEMAWWEQVLALSEKPAAAQAKHNLR